MQRGVIFNEQTTSPVQQSAKAKVAFSKAVKLQAKLEAAELIQEAKAASVHAIRFLDSVVRNSKADLAVRVSAAGKLLALGWSAAPTKVQGQFDFNVTETHVVTPQMVRQAALRLVSQRAEDEA